MRSLTTDLAWVRPGVGAAEYADNGCCQFLALGITRRLSDGPAGPTRRRLVAMEVRLLRSLRLSQSGQPGQSH